MANFLGIVLAAGKGTRMKSDLPKVLHKVNDVPMVSHCVTALEKAGADKIVVVVGYRKELVIEELKGRAEFAVQTEQKGTGHAVLSAHEHIENYQGDVVVVYGDNPLLTPQTIQRLWQAAQQKDCAGSLLTIKLDNPPEAGRIIRDDQGHFVQVIEEQDCTESEKQVKEINCGTYCFKGELLVSALHALKPENSQGEYYLTDVPEILVKQGHKVETVEAEDIFDILGVNDQHHRRFAETAKDIRYAESLFEVIEAAINQNKAG